MTPPVLNQLIAQDRIERIPADPASAKERLKTVRAHLTAAESIISFDPDGAYALAYDAARKAISAHMLAAGFRARNRQGAHQAVVLYALAEIPEFGTGGATRHLDRMRRTRNTSEYSGGTVTETQALHAIEISTRLLASVEHYWPDA